MQFPAQHVVPIEILPTHPLAARICISTYPFHRVLLGSVISDHDTGMFHMSLNMY